MQIPRIEHSVESLVNHVNAPVGKRLQPEQPPKIAALRPPCHAGNSLGGSLRESLLDLVSSGTDGGMNPSCIVLLLGRKRQIDWFASLLDSSQAILVAALKCNVTCHALERLGTSHSSYHTLCKYVE